MVSKKTKRARLNSGELVYTFYFKLQHNSIISPEYSDGNDDAYDVMYYSYFVFFVLQIYKRKTIFQTSSLIFKEKKIRKTSLPDNYAYHQLSYLQTIISQVPISNLLSSQ